MTHTVDTLADGTVVYRTDPGAEPSRVEISWSLTNDARHDRYAAARAAGLMYSAAESEAVGRAVFTRPTLTRSAVIGEPFRFDWPRPEPIAPAQWLADAIATVHVCARALVSLHQRTPGAERAVIAAADVIVPSLWDLGAALGLGVLPAPSRDTDGVPDSGSLGFFRELPRTLVTYLEPHEVENLHDVGTALAALAVVADSCGRILDATEGA